MSRKMKDLQRLANATEAAFVAAQSELRAKASVEAAIQSELHTLAEARSQILGTLVLSEERGAAQVLCQGAALIHAEQRRARLNIALAHARALAMRERQKAQRAFGRQQAARRLVETAHKSAARRDDP